MLAKALQFRRNINCRIPLFFRAYFDFLKTVKKQCLTEKIKSCILLKINV